MSDIVDRLDQMAVWDPFRNSASRRVSCPDGHQYALEVGGNDILLGYNCLGCRKVFHIHREDDTVHWGNPWLWDMEDKKYSCQRNCYEEYHDLFGRDLGLDNSMP